MLGGSKTWPHILASSKKLEIFYKLTFIDSTKGKLIVTRDIMALQD